ncbi:hypothetical protein GCM10027419_50120 [Pandoraea terrae]
MVKHSLASLGQRHLAYNALEQRKPDHGFELLDLHRHRGLRQVQFRCCAHDACVSCNSDEDLQLAKG